MRFRLRWPLLCLSLLAIASPVFAAGKPWTEVRSPHFRVLTNGDPSDARHVAHEFEQMRYVFAAAFPQFRLESGAPLTIFAARDEATAKALEPAVWKMKGVKPAGIFHHSWERQYVLVRLDVGGGSPPAVVYHEYTHSILHMNAHWLPLWLDEGLAEFYGYTQFQPHRIYVGGPSARYSVLQGLLIPVKTLIAVDQRSPYYHDANKAQMFYAESWALVHYMIFGPGMEGGAKLNRFYSLLQQGEDQDQAFRQVFGDFADVDKNLALYLRRLALTASVLKDPPQIEDKDFTVTKLTAAQTEAELAGFHLWNHDPADAQPLVDQALKDDPKLGFAHEEEGFLLFAQGKDAEASEEFSRACALDGKLYLSLFAKTMLSPIAASAAPADEAAFHSALAEVADLNNQFAPAYVELARLAVRRNRLATALGLSRRAEELEPSRAGYHVLSGWILLLMGEDDQAAESARYVAQRWYGPDHDEAVELWNSIPAARRPAGEPLAEDPLGGTKAVTGTLKSVTCGGLGKQAAFVLMRGGEEFTFHTNGPFADGFSDTLWYGEDHYSDCLHLAGLRAEVRYRPASGSGYTGDITEIEVRDVLPVPAGAAAEVQQAAKP